MRFARTFDLDLVRRIMTHDRIWPYISDDSSGDAASFTPVDSPAICYLLCYDGDRLMGMWMFVQTNAAMLEVHTCLLPGHGFRRARQAAREAAEWIWENTSCQRIWTQVPQGNRIAWKFAEDAGMKVCGVQPNGFIKDGKSQNLILLGMGRPVSQENDVMSSSQKVEAAPRLVVQ